ncbi:MAG: glycosyltransferase family 9 protein [Anaerolineales bacterium]
MAENFIFTNKNRNPFPIEKIIIFRALQLGDMLNAVPAFRALRAAYPEAYITLAGLPWCDKFVERFHAYLDDFITFPGYPGLPEQKPDLPAILSFLENMQRQKFDLAIQMQGSGDIVNPMIELFGAKQTAGYYLPDQYCPDPDFYLIYPDGEPESRRHLHLMDFLGIPLQGSDLELPLFEEDWTSLQQIKDQYRLRNDYVCIHPGARGLHRRWAPEKFAVVADWLTALGYQVVLTGSAEEAELTSKVNQYMQAKAIDLAGKTDLGTLGALVSQAHLVVSNDTGMSHVAAALKVPSVILFAVSHSVRWAPTNEQLHKRIWDAMDKNPEQVILQIEKHMVNIYTRPELSMERAPATSLKGATL